MLSCLQLHSDEVRVRVRVRARVRQRVTMGMRLC